MEWIRASAQHVWPCFDESFRKCWGKMSQETLPVFEMSPKKTTTHNTPKVFRHTYTRDGTSSTGNSEMNWVSKRCLHPGPLLCNHFDPLLGNCCNSCNPRSAFFSSAPFRCIYRQPCERSQANGEESSGHNPSYRHVFSAIYTGLVITPCITRGFPHLFFQNPTIFSNVPIVFWKIVS